MAERGITEAWVADVLRNWVARKWDYVNQSMNYYGFVQGTSRMLKVAVSADNLHICTTHFDSRAARLYRERRDFFDEVKDDPSS